MSIDRLKNTKLNVVFGFLCNEIVFLINLFDHSAVEKLAYLTL